MDILFFREEGMSEKGHSTYINCNYIVMAKEIGKPYILLPYSIWYCEDSRCFVAVTVKNNPTVDTVLNSNRHEEEAEAFNRLRDAKDYLYHKAKMELANGILEGAN